MKEKRIGLEIKETKRAEPCTFKLSGRVKIVHKDSNGRIKSTSYSNLIVDSGKNHIIALMMNSAPAQMQYIGIGDNNQTPDVTDTQLIGTELFRKVSGKSSGPKTITYTSDFAATEGTGSVQEAGIFNGATIGSGDMLCRTIFDAKNKGAGDSLNLTWTITIS